MRGRGKRNRKDKRKETVRRFSNSIHFMIWWEFLGYNVICDAAPLRGFCHRIRLQGTIHTMFHVSGSLLGY
jgi:hypothetical protein